MPANNPYVLLIANDGANPLGIARSLGRKNVPLFVITESKPSILAYSRYIKKVFYVSSFHNTDEMKNALAATLALMTAGQAKPALWVTNESHYADLLTLNNFIQEHFHIVNLLDRCVFLSDKQNQFPLAEQAGFSIPQTVVLRRVDDLEQAKTLHYPVIVKPAANKTRGQFHDKTKLFEDAESLAAELALFLNDAGIELIAQEYISGGDESVVFAFLSCLNGESRLYLTGRKVRQNPPGQGLMSAGIAEKLPDVFIKKCQGLCRLFAMTGFVGIECKEYSGKYYYIESSLRVDGNNSLGLAAGVDIVYDSYLACIGEPFRTTPDLPALRGSWADMELELGTAKILRQRGDANCRNVFHRLPRPISWAYFHWTDPLPWLMQTWKLLKQRLFKH